jgi:hypothetical protein
MPMPVELHNLMRRYCQLGTMLRWPQDEGCDRDVLELVVREMDAIAKQMHIKFGMPDFSTSCPEERRNKAGPS